jgi:hypothetical protein
MHSGTVHVGCQINIIIVKAVSTLSDHGVMIINTTVLSAEKIAWVQLQNLYRLLSYGRNGPLERLCQFRPEQLLLDQANQLSRKSCSALSLFVGSRIRHLRMNAAADGISRSLTLCCWR